MSTPEEIRERFANMDILVFLAKPHCVLKWRSVLLDGMDQALPLITFLKAIGVSPEQMLALDHGDQFLDQDVSGLTLDDMADLWFPAGEHYFACLAGIVGKPIKAAYEENPGSARWVFTIDADGNILEDWR